MRRVAPAFTCLLSLVSLAPVSAWAQTAPNTTPTPAPTAAATAGPTETPPTAETGTPSTDAEVTAPTTTPAPTDPPSAAAMLGPAIVPTPAPVDLDRRALPVVEIHGYLRSRAELFHDFTLGWDRTVSNMVAGMPRTIDPSVYAMSGVPWTRNPDNYSGWCNPTVADGTYTANMAIPCANGTQTMANMRLRLAPEFHPTEYLAVHTLFDVLDNLVLGSTPEGLYTSGATSPFAPITFFTPSATQPIYGLNALTTSIAVKRAWGEATSPTLGTIRFGRMPWNWGLGMLQNAGNGLDSDFQTTVDRFQYQGRYRPLSLFFMAMWDFPSTGATSQRRAIDPGQGQPYDLSMLDDVHQWVIAGGRKVELDEQRAALSRGEIVINGGAYFALRTQFLSGEGVIRDAATRMNGNGMLGAIEVGSDSAAQTYGVGLARRDAFALTSDGWFQLLGRTWRVEGELAYTRGWMYSADTSAASRRDGFYISQFGALLDAELRPIPKLTLRLKIGYASGDAEVEGLSTANPLQQLNNDPFLSTFRFHPDYRVDLIFWRQLQRQFSGAYFFRPGAQYNFIDDPDGNLFFGRVDIIWSRASEWVSTRGNHADLGIEIDATLQFQSNHRREVHDVRPAPGFYGMVQYGVFFPLQGLGPTQAEATTTASGARAFEFLVPQTVRGVVGITF